MEKVDLMGIPPEVTQYISRFENKVQEQSKTVESQKVRIRPADGYTGQVPKDHVRSIQRKEQICIERG